MKFNPDVAEEDDRDGAGGAAAAAADPGVAAGAAVSGAGESGGGDSSGRRKIPRLAILALGFMILCVGIVVTLSITSSSKGQSRAGAPAASRSPAPGASNEGNSGALARLESDLSEEDSGPPKLGGDDGYSRDGKGPAGPSALKLGAEPETLRDRSFTDERGGAQGEEGRGLSGSRRAGGASGSDTDEAGRDGTVAAKARVSSGGGNGRSTVSIRYANVPAAAATNVSAVSTAVKNGREGEDSQAYVLPPFDTMLPVTVVGTFYSPSSSASLVRMALSATVSGEGWELPRGTLVLGRAANVVAKNRVEVTVIGFIDPARNRFIRMGGEVADTYGSVGFPGEVKNGASLLRRAGRTALRVLPGVAGGVVGGGYVYPYGGLVPGVGGVGESGSQEYVAVKAGTSGFVLVRNIPETEPGRDAGGQFTPEEMEIIRSLRQAQGGGDK